MTGKLHDPSEILFHIPISILRRYGLIRLILQYPPPKRESEHSSIGMREHRK